MGEHHYNETARANSGPRDRVQALDLGEQIALLGIQVMPVMDEKKENLVVLLCAVGGPLSPIVGAFAPRPIVLAELGKFPLAAVRKALRGGASVGPDSGGTPPAVGPVTTTGATATDAPSDAEPEEGGLLMFRGRK